MNVLVLLEVVSEGELLPSGLAHMFFSFKMPCFDVPGQGIFGLEHSLTSLEVAYENLV